MDGGEGTARHLTLPLAGTKIETVTVAGHAMGGSVLAGENGFELALQDELTYLFPKSRTTTCGSRRR